MIGDSPQEARRLRIIIDDKVIYQCLIGLPLNDVHQLLISESQVWNAKEKHAIAGCANVEVPGILTTPVRMYQGLYEVRKSHI
jgi:hypothetical protein